MKIFSQSTIGIFIMWLLIVPAGTIYIGLNYFPEELNWLTIFIIGLFGFLTVYFPLKRKGTPIFTAMWVTVPVFLLYGLFIEIIVMQIAVLGILFSPAVKSKRLYYFFFDSFWFFIMSIAGAMAFFIVGGEIGSIEFWPLLLAVFCYQFVHTTATRSIIKLYMAYSVIKSAIFTGNELINYGKIFILLPFSLTLYFLYQDIGVAAILLLAIPYFFLTYIVRMNSITEKVNANLQRAGAIGHEISGNLTVDKVIDQFVMKVSEMFNTEYAYLFDYQDGQLELLRSYENSGFVKTASDPLLPGLCIAEAALRQNKPIIYSRREQWEGVTDDYSVNQMQSILCVPISYNKKIVAVLLLASTRKNAFQEYQLKILDLLCSYFTVSLEKARYVQDIVVESNRCALTKLHNFGYLEKWLASDMSMIKDGLLDELSVVMLDIDHFKKINDTYGHQSGNDILCALADILREKLPKGSIVTRYGGEEFVYLLRGFRKEAALQFAEELRLQIEQAEFLVMPDLGMDKTMVSVRITASLGVASAPEDADDAQSILRNADRSLYLWAKQAGRNRVAGYVK